VSRIGSKRASNVKRIIIFGIIGALLASTFALVYSTRFAEEKREEVNKQAEEVFKLARCGDGIARSTTYIQEFLLPSECSMPVGIAIDKQGNVWTVSSSKNKVIKYEPMLNRFDEFDIPSKQVTKDIPFPVWAVLADEKDRLWFTDAENNSIWLFDTLSKEFKQFKLQSTSEFGTSMPVDMKMHSNKLWFIGVYSKHIGMIDTSTLELKELPINVELQALGTLALDEQGNVWFTALTLGSKGSLYKLDINTDQITTYDLPITSPVGTSIDSDGNIWINDHGSNMFIMFNPNTKEIVKYVTPLPSKYTNLGLYDKCIKDNGSPLTCGGYQVSLPYWNAIDSKGRVWFNEHQGNAIAVFDPKTLTLIEYHIPTYNRAWGSCDNYGNEPCGIANPLRFTLADDDTVWFTEFSDNKIARLDASKALPYTLEVKEHTYTIKRGGSISIPLTITSKIGASIEMVIASTETPEGRIRDINAEFSERVFDIQAESSKVINLTVKASDGLEQGEYTLTIGARSKDITYSRVVKLIVE
jgi:virginiamycin B lyase